MLFSRATFPIVLIATAISNSILVHARPHTIRELFDVSFDASVGGNCAQWGEARLNSIVSDAFDLAQVGLSVVDAATDINNDFHDEAFRLLAAWFLKPFLSAAEYSRIKDTYQSVHGFLSGSITAVNGGQSTVKPVLVCGDSWVIRQSMSDQALQLDEAGRAVPVATDPALGRPQLVREVKVYREKHAAAADLHKQEAFPYWSTRMGEYFFNKKYGDDPTSFWCSVVSAHTLSQGPRASIVALCDRSFNGRRLHDEDPDCVNANTFTGRKAPNAAAPITTVTPDAGSFFHELIHLIYGSAATTPAGGEVYMASKLLGFAPRPETRSVMTFSEAIINPQTFMFVAIGFDYTMNYGTGFGRRREWYTGRCTFQE